MDPKRLEGEQRDMARRVYYVSLGSESSLYGQRTLSMDYRRFTAAPRFGLVINSGSHSAGHGSGCPRLTMFGSRFYLSQQA